MRLSLSRTLALAAFVTGVVVAGVAHAQSFNAAVWVPLERAGVAVGDVVGPGTSDTDIVGSAANPAAYLWSDATDLYIRLRVNDKPTLANDAFKDAHWGCLVDTNATLTNYEFMAVLAGQPGEVHWRYNGAPAVGANVPNEPAEVLVGSSPVATNGRTVDAPSAPLFSGNADWFVDLAVPWATIRAGGAGAPAVPAGTPMRFACGTSSLGFHIGTDQATTDPAGALTGTWSDPYVCTNTGCALDRDGDGVPDAIEIMFSTSPTNADSDGDGIPDNVELSSGAGPFGPFTGPDSDGDATRDALDVDSDNDCRPDALEGVGSYRLATVPSVSASANCSGATPVCLVTLGKCNACSADFGVAAPAACPSAASPACNLVGPSAGMCTQCTPTNTAFCPSAMPVCDAVFSTCAACDGDRGGGAVRACPKTASPYCTLAGPSVGQCGKCTSDADCGDPHTGPKCDAFSGACVDVDSDGDGLNDTVEKLLGTNPSKTDTDGDGIGDLTEVTPQGGGATTKVNSDGDGTIDALDLDSDNDGVPDKAEGATDVDADGLANYRDEDDDGDGIATKTELADALAARVSDDVDGDGAKNYADTDADGDGKSDVVEGRSDTDMDGIPDYLDNDKVAVVDAGPDAVAPPEMEAGVAPVPVAPTDQGVIEGTGLFCAVSQGAGRTGASWAVLVGLLGLALAGVVRTRRSRHRR